MACGQRDRLFQVTHVYHEMPKDVVLVANVVVHDAFSRMKKRRKECVPCDDGIAGVFAPCKLSFVIGLG